MDEDLKELLVSWNINQRYAQRLEDEEILSIEMLLELSDDNIKQIFTTVGAYVTFTKNFNKFKSDKVAAANDSTVEDDNGNSSSSNKMPDQTKDLESSSNPTEQVLQQNSTDQLEQDNPTTEQFEQDNPTDQVQQENQTVTRNNETLTADTSRKRKYTSHTDLDLQKLLEMSVDGKAVIAYYTASQNLNDTMRNTLADVVINEHLKDDYDRKFSYESEIFYAEKIVELFPSESKAIWSSPTPCARQSTDGRRRLVQRYYQKRRFLKRGKLLKTDEKEKGTLNMSTDDADNPGNDDVLWLQNSKQPWSKVEELWKATSTYRLQKLRAGTTSTSSYMNAYPALRDPTGYLLMEIDFDMEFPNSRVNLFAKWPQLSAFIESKLPKVELDKIKNCLTEEGKRIMTICSLPYLFQVTTCARKGKNKLWRPSRLEVGEALLLHVKCNGDIEPTLINRLKDKYEPYNLTLGPQAIVVGTDVDAIEQCYVRVNNILYKVDNPRKAVDITFKIFHSLDGKYHSEAEREWLFLERAVYGLNAGKDGDGRIRSVCAEYEKFKTPSH